MSAERRTRDGRRWCGGIGGGPFAVLRPATAIYELLRVVIVVMFLGWFGS